MNRLLNETTPHPGDNGQSTEDGINVSDLRQGDRQPVLPNTGIDLADLRMTQDFGAAVSVKKLLTTVPCRKPTRQEFVRVHPDESHRLQTAVLELKDERETFIVHNSLWPELPGEIVPKLLVTSTNRQGIVFLWPIRLPGEDGRLDSWNQAALEAVTIAQTKWIRVSANMSLGAYEIFEATGELPDPQWPDESFDHLLQIAFKNNYITQLDHPVIRRLRGEV